MMKGSRTTHATAAGCVFASFMMFLEVDYSFATAVSVSYFAFPQFYSHISFSYTPNIL